MHPPVGWNSPEQRLTSLPLQLLGTGPTHSSEIAALCERAPPDLQRTRRKELGFFFLFFCAYRTCVARHSVALGQRSASPTCTRGLLLAFAHSRFLPTLTGSTSSPAFTARVSQCLFTLVRADTQSFQGILVRVSRHFAIQCRTRFSCSQCSLSRFVLFALREVRR